MAALGMDPSEYEDALRRIHKKEKQTAKHDTDSDENLVAQLACYAIRELHAKGVPPNTAIRAMTILRYSEKKQPTGNAIKQAKLEIHNNTHPAGTAKKLKATLNTARGGPSADLAFSHPQTVLYGDT